MKLLTKAKSNLDALKNVRKLGAYVPTGVTLLKKEVYPKKSTYCVLCKKRR